MNTDIVRYTVEDIEQAVKHIQIQTTQGAPLKFQTTDYKPEIPDAVLQAIPNDATLKLLIEEPEKYTSPTLQDKSPSGYR